MTAIKTLAEATAAAEDVYSHFLRSGPDPYHAVFSELAALCARRSNLRVLEIGSRQITRKNSFANVAKYVGLDIHPGPGVDLVGDAHELSKLFPENYFDLVLSVSVFEHLAFPWKVVMETNKVLRHGGLTYLSTHPTWPPHELPWDFWRFPINGLRLLFSAPLGFEILKIADGIPAKLHSLSPDAPTRGVSAFEMSMGVALIAEKVSDYDQQSIRWDIPLPSVLNSFYPKRSGE